MSLAITGINAILPGMKAMRPFIAVAGLLCGVSVTSAADKPTAPSPVEVTFDKSAEFSDFTQSHTSKDYQQEPLMAEFRQFLQDKIAPRLAPGQRVEIKFTNIDLAGDFEPWHGPNAQDIRIVKEIYPPRATLDFRVLNADGSVAAEGHRELQKLGFMISPGFPTSDPLRYEKEMLNDWVRQDFPAKKK